MDITQQQHYWLEHDFVSELLKYLPVQIFWKNKDGIYLGCNENFAKSVGLSSSIDVIGKSDYELPVNKEDSDSYRKDDNEIMNTRRPKLNIEEKQRLPNGREVILLTSKAPIFDKCNEVIGILGIYSDITARKEAEEREKKAVLLEAADAKIKAQLEENLRMAVTVFAGRMAHDIRTPLAILLLKGANLETLMPILLEGYRKAKESGLEIEPINSTALNYLQEIPQTIEHEINKLNEFINSTLKMLSRIVRNELSQEDLEVCWIRTVIDRALRDYPYADESQKSLIEHTRGANFTFLGNDILLIYAFYNLIKNSFYQIEKNKKGKIYITTEVGAEANFVRLKDTAGGASPEIVKEFFSGYKTSKADGTGLGLASIKQTMQLFGGDITCESVEGDFIEFIFTFPKIKK